MSRQSIFAIVLFIALGAAIPARAQHPGGGPPPTPPGTFGATPSPSPKPSPSPSPTPPTMHQRLHFSFPGLRPDDPTARTSNIAVDRAIDRLSIPPATPAPANPEPGKDVKEMKDVKDVVPPAGCDGWFCNPSVFTEYDFVHSADLRQFGFDSTTNAFSLGGDFFTKGNVLVGLIYTFNDQADRSSFLKTRGDEYDNLVSLYLAKNFWNWVNVGIAGGYSYTGANETLLGPGGFSAGYSNNQWNIAPFVGVAHTWGAFSASLTTTYLDEWNRTSGIDVIPGFESRVDLFEFTLRLGYQVTDKLKVEAYSRFVQVVDVPPESVFLPEDRNWWVFGTKIGYQVCQPCQLYVGYEYAAFDRSYVDHTVKAGLSVAFW